MFPGMRSKVMRFFPAFVFFVLSQTALCQDPWKNVYRESAWEDRDKWQCADKLLGFLKIQEGSHVADIGCHEGYMTVKLSKTVKAKGKVYAIDVDQSRLNTLKRRLEDRKIENVTVVKGDYDNPKLPTNALDAVIILDTYHEMDDHDKILDHIKSSLKKGGRLVLCEPIAENRRGLSRADQETKHELGINYAIEDLEKAGFSIIHKEDPFVDRHDVKGDMMWVIVAVKK